MREKERRGNVTILLPHLCFKVAPCSSYRESLELSLSYTSGNFHYRTWLVYSNDGLPQTPEVFMSKQVGCTPTQFQFELSYTYSSSASVAWQSLLLALTWPVDYPRQCETFSFLSSPHNPHHHILFHPQCYIHGSRSYIA